MIKAYLMYSITLLLLSSPLACAQIQDSAVHRAEVTAHLVVGRIPVAKHTPQAPPGVIWLKSLQAAASPTIAPGAFTLLQKDKMFSPHLLVVPVGSSVAFPNADPFFHNVFSLFDGRRFDLGLYEAGSTRSVVFSREGISYIFCNIHSEMSAVVISLTTPYYAVADQQSVFHLGGIPDGDYELHVWVEGQRQSSLDHLTRRVHISGDSSNLGEIVVGQGQPARHLNKFGHPYEPDTHPIY